MHQKEEVVVDKETFEDACVNRVKTISKMIDQLTEEIQSYVDILHWAEKDSRKYILKYSLTKDNLFYERVSKKHIGF